MGQTLGCYLLCALASTGLIRAGELSGLQIMKMERERQELKDEEQTLEMHIVDRRGREKVRSVRIWTLSQSDGRHKILLVFDSPRDVKGTGLLTWEHEARDDDQWLYLPSLKREKRIASSGKKNRFMGTDFSFEDLEVENLDRYQYKLLEKKELNGLSCYRVEATLKDEKNARNTHYGKRILWVREDISFTMKIEYFDKKGRPIKILENEPPEQVSDTAWRTRSYSMKDLKRGTSTKMILKDRKVNQGLEDHFFTIRQLKKLK